MSATSSPVDVKLPQRSSTVTSSFTRRTSMSDDEAIPDTDSSETTKLLLERLKAWKHMCGYLEDYVSVTAKVQKSQAKDYEKILKTVSDPLKEGHHFSQSVGGVAGMFENIRSNTQGMVNMYLETEKNLKGSLLPTLERLHKEIKNKAKELQSGAVKGAKAVEKARGLTQKHIELLAQQTGSFDAAGGSKIEKSHDPYVLRRGVNHRLNKQVIEENNHCQDVLAVQNNFQQFEAHVLETVQTSLDQFFQFMGGQADNQRAMYADILASAQKIPPDFEWMNFITKNDAVLINPDTPPRALANITFPNQDHRATKPLIEGSLERKSRAVIMGFSTGYYVVTPARYLHEFKDDDDFRKDPSPDLSLYLPDCVVGAIDGVKFSVKGKDVSSNVVGNAFHTTTELNFKAHTPSDAENWWTVIKDATRGPHRSTSSGPTSPAAVVSPTSPSSTDAALPPAYAEKQKLAEAQGEQAAETDAQDHAQNPTSPPVATGISRSATTAAGHSNTSPLAGNTVKRSASTATGHFHTSPGGSALDSEKEKDKS